MVLVGTQGFPAASGLACAGARIDPSTSLLSCDMRSPKPASDSGGRVSGQRGRGGHGGRGGRGGQAGARWQPREVKVACNWYASGFCKHADKCSKRGEPCCNATNILDLEEAWLGGRDPSMPATRTLQSVPVAKVSATNDIEYVLVLDIEGGANDRPGEDEIIEVRREEEAH